MINKFKIFNSSNKFSVTLVQYGKPRRYIALHKEPIKMIRYFFNFGNVSIKVVIIVSNVANLN